MATLMVGNQLDLVYARKKILPRLAAQGHRGAHSQLVICAGSSSVNSSRQMEHTSSGTSITGTTRRERSISDAAGPADASVAVDGWAGVASSSSAVSAA